MDRGRGPLDRRRPALVLRAAGAPPAVGTDGTAIDAFVAAAHRERGLAFAPEAGAAVLARRLALDLTGLPPSVAGVTALEAAAGTPAWTGALEACVERLLASVEFGVRWARMWLDHRPLRRLARLPA